jgi:hypothetical protein
MKRYNVTRYIQHNGQLYLPGATIDLFDEQAERLKDTIYPAIEGDGVPISDAGSGGNGDEGLYDFGEPIPLFRMVYQQSNGQIYLANNDQEEQCRTVLGIATSDENEQIRVKYEGKIVNSDWNFSRGKPLFLHTNGQIKQTVPTSGHILQIGEALGKTSINLEIKEVEIRNSQS